ncbi:MAG: TRAP transporter large permease subunit [Marivibrio sp.]|uniref:TRAP transporter large permease n=1 Tax=Marivibrio sp. TaxID=2039719 RepID=UPI0032ED8756
MPSADNDVTLETPAGAPQGAGGRAQGAARVVLHRLDQLVGGAAALALAALIAIVFANVVARYVFNNSMTWASEAAQWLFIAMIFLAVPLAHRSRRHLSINLLVDRLPPKGRSAAGLLGDVVVAYATIMLLFGGAFLMEVLGGVNHALQAPVWVKFAAVPASCAAGLVFLALRGLEEGTQVWRQPAAIALAFALYWVMQEGPGVGALKGLDPTAVMAAAFLIAMALGAPVAFAMIFSAFVANEAGGVLPPAAVVQTMVNGSSKFLLLAIPFFIAAGALMNAGGLTRRLMDFAFTLVGHFRGGLAQVNVVSSGLYAGISGSSYSEAALGTKLLVPQMVRRGYAAPFACAVTAASATLPNVIPPSIALLILAAASNLSVGDLWLAGVGPGLLMGASLMLCLYVIARRRGYGAAVDRASGGERGRAALGALPVLGLAVFIIGGIRFGVVTPTEAGVLAVVYALILGLVVYRAYTGRGLWESLREAAVEAALVGLLIGAAAPFAFVLVSQGAPQAIIATMAGIAETPIVLLLIANLVMLLFGMFLDIGAAILILTPLLMPLMIEAGVDPVHFGVVIVVNLMLGGLTPPVGMLAFITGSISRTPVHEVFRAMIPLLATLIAALLVITYTPAVSLGLGWLIS